MALALFDRVQETTTTTGTGSVTLGGAVPGFQSFAVVGNGNTCYYTIVDGTAWEVGVGTYSTSGPTLARTTVLSNSSGNTSPITLAAGTKSIFLTYPAEKSVNLDGSNNVSPLGTVSSGVWQGSTVGVAYGGTGVTSSSGANSVVLRDSNQNITVNRINQGLLTTTASGGTTTLTAASAFNQALVGTGGHTYRLPDATTLSDTTTFQFNNNATGTLTIQNNAGTSVGTIAPGGAAGIALLSNATVGGTWDVHAYIPENVTWGTNALALGSTVITGGTWQGGTIQPAYGGTGLTSYTSGGAVYANSSSTLTSGTLPLTAGGTAATTASGARTSLDVPSTTGSGASGTWGINISGNAATATNSTTTSQTNFSNLTIGGSQVLYAGNYNSYAPTLTGTGASGTWGINISGNAATATNSTTTSQTNFSNLTIGGSQVLYAGNYNSYAPTLTGTGATGTWAINISGNAATATTATSAPNYLPLAGGTMTGPMYSPQYDNSSRVVFNSSSTYYLGLVGNVSTGGGSLSMVQYTSPNGSAAAAVNSYPLLHSGNYNSYAPTLTGTGATGTWAINISGNAATATSSTSSTTATTAVNLSGGPVVTGGSTQPYIQLNSSNYTTTYPASFGVRSDASGDLRMGNNYYNDFAAGTQNVGGFFRFYVNNTTAFPNAINGTLALTMASSGSVTASVDSRAPIFYDSDNTSYYVNPAGSSVLSFTTFTSISDNQIVLNGNGSSWAGIQFVDVAGNDFIWYNGSGSTFAIGGGGSNVSGKKLHVNGGTTIGSGLASTSVSTNGLLVETRVDAPIFYDSDNTAYYVNPNGTSNILKLYVGGASVSTGWNGVFASDGIGAAGGNKLIYLYNDGGSNIKLDAYDYGTASALNINIGGNGGYTTINSSVRSPIFYDSNNTGYYVDPAGVSVLNNLLMSYAAVSNNNNGLRNVMPGGGSYVTTTATVSGAIVITLPVTVYPMLRMTIKVYTYDGLSFDINCGGHNSSGFWYNTFAYMTSQNRPPLTVRFCYGGGNMYVYIGDLGSSWAYPQVFITDVQVGYVNYEYDRWDDGWVVGFNSSTYNNISSSHTVYPQPQSSNNTGALYAPIFYDADNTGTYINPNGASVISAGGTYPMEFRSTQRYITRFWNQSASGAGWWLANDSNTLIFHADSVGDRASLDSSANFTAYGSSRAPIFYDSDNTSYYTSPNGNSVFANLGLGGVTPDVRLSINGDAHLAGGVFYLGGTAGSYNSWGSRDYTTSGLRYFNANSFEFNNYGYGSNWYFTLNGGIGQASASLRAPIFYDSDNTAYYVDPAPGSNGVSANFQGRIQLGTFNNSQNNNGEAWIGRASDRNAGTCTVQLGGASSSGRSFEVVDYAWTVVLFSCSSAGNGTFSGNVTAYSDERLKTDWADVSIGFVEKLAKVKSGTYTRIDTGARQAGVGAQSLQPLLPEVVLDEGPHLAVAYGNAAMVSAVELAKYVTALEQRISQLEARL